MRKAGISGLLILLFAATVAGLREVAKDEPKPLAKVAYLPERLRARLFPPRAPKKALLTSREQEAVRDLGRRLDGLIVWSSNRNGPHQLYLVDLHEQVVRQLTHARNASFFARISPAGRHIAFLRSQRESGSVRDPTAWDAYLMNVDGTGEQRIAVGGYHPTWTADGAGIIFHRKTRVFRYNLATRQETLLVDAAPELPGIDDDLGDVELAPDGRRLAFVLRGQFSGAHGLTGPFSGAAVLDLDTHQLTLLTREQACQTTWALEGRSVVWMETGGNGGTRVMTGAVDGTGRQVFMDLPGAYSHEYFPKLSNDGRWLVWGAAAEGHEQDQADYEIFVWKIGTPWDQAVRLTSHPGNDTWPDLWVRRHP